MSEASIPHTTWSTYLFRLLVLLAAALVLVVLSPKPARADGLLQDATGTVSDTVDPVASDASEAVDQVLSSTTPTIGPVVTSSTDAVEEVVATSVGSLDDVVSSTTGAVDQVVSSTNGTVDQVLTTLVQVAGGPGDAGSPEHTPPASSIPAPSVPVPTASTPAPPAHHHEPVVVHDPPAGAHHRGAMATSHGRSSAEAMLQPAIARSTFAPSSHRPSVPQGGTGGATIPGGGGGAPDLGGRGGQLAATLVAALVLAVASSRRLRQLAVARAPNPFFSILAPPG